MKVVLKLLMLSLLTSCLHSCSQSKSSSLPVENIHSSKRQTLIQQFRRSGKISIIYGIGSEEKTYESLANQLKDRLSSMYDVKVLPSSDELLIAPEGMVFLIGTPEANPQTQSLLQELDLSLDSPDQKFGSQSLKASDVIFFSLLLSHLSSLFYFRITPKSANLHQCGG